MISIEYAYRRFERIRFPLPNENQVAALERRIGIELPADYREYLLSFNGGFFTEPEVVSNSEECPPAYLTDMFGIGATHPSAELARSLHLDLFDGNSPPQILPIGSTPMGSLIILVTRMDEERGRILFKQAFGDFYHLADGIEEFFGLLHERADG